MKGFNLQRQDNLIFLTRNSSDCFVFTYYILRGDRVPQILKLFHFRKSCYQDPKTNLNYEKFPYCGDKCVLCGRPYCAPTAHPLDYLTVARSTSGFTTWWIAGKWRQWKVLLLDTQILSWLRNPAVFLPPLKEAKPIMPHLHIHFSISNLQRCLFFGFPLEPVKISA